jgi:hypothetical protein
MEGELKRVDTIARVRRAFHVQGWSVKKIVWELHVSRNTVRKILRSNETDFSYKRERQPLPKTGAWKAEIERFLSANEGKPSREWLTLIGKAEIQSHQPQHGRQKALRLAQPQAEYEPQGQGGLNRQIGITRLASSCLASWRCPTINSLRRHPKGQTATLAQTRIILGPVRHLELHFADVMTASGVMFVWHG